MILIAAVALAAGPASAAIGPTDELRQYTDRVLEVLRAPGMSPAERRTAVRNLAIEVFDVGETAKRALGPHWQQRTPAERADFVKLFRDLLEQTYISRIDEYGGERIQYTGERIDGESAVVRAQILTKAGTTVPVESRLILKNGHWLIYDILIENVSLVANYRSQFDRIIRTSSYDDLVKRLRDRLAQLNQGVDPTRPAKATPAR
jgi:phospholipid transport system substrate-binding protein